MYKIFENKLFLKETIKKVTSFFLSTQSLFMEKFLKSKNASK